MAGIEPDQAALRRQVLASVDSFISANLAERAAEIDATDAYPWDLHKIATERGLFAMALPEAYGGLDLVTRLEIIERIARVSASFAVILST